MFWCYFAFLTKRIYIRIMLSGVRSWVLKHSHRIVSRWVIFFLDLLLVAELLVLDASVMGKGGEMLKKIVPGYTNEKILS